MKYSFIWFALKLSYCFIYSLRYLYSHHVPGIEADGVASLNHNSRIYQRLSGSQADSTTYSLLLNPSNPQVPHLQTGRYTGIDFTGL